MQIIFASANAHKASEIQAMVPNGLIVTTMDSVGIVEAIPEPFDTLHENAAAKAEYVFQKLGLACFSEDSGLEIDALDGKPGVHSAHYAGPNRNAQDNMHKVLSELHGNTNRKAQFRTIIHAIIQGEHHQFEGIVHGTIAEFPQGENGFGYDPIFIPDGYGHTFGELDADVKLSISHRSRAFEAFLLFLERRPDLFN